MKRFLEWLQESLDKELEELKLRRDMLQKVLDSTRTRQIPGGTPGYYYQGKKLSPEDLAWLQDNIPKLTRRIQEIEGQIYGSSYTRWHSG
jgi:hypothetical protein